MLAFLVRRLVLAFLVLVAVSFGSFWFFARNFYVAPGTLLPVPPATAWWQWFSGIPHGTLARGVYGQDLWPRILPPLGHTAALLAYSFLLVIVFALAIGTISAVRAGSLLDILLRGFSYAAWSMPAFLLALILQKLLGVVWADLHVHALPVGGWPGHCFVPLYGGFTNADCSAHGVGYLWSLVRSLTVPAIALATSFIGLHARYVRSSLLVALDAPYTMTARAKGLPERQVVLRHALRTSLVAFVSALLLDFGSVFGAAMAVDWVFELGGIGTAFIAAIAGTSIDPHLVQLILMLTAAFVLLSSLLADLAVAWLDPRVRLR